MAFIIKIETVNPFNKDEISQAFQELETIEEVNRLYESTMKDYPSFNFEAFEVSPVKLDPKVKEKWTTVHETELKVKLDMIKNGIDYSESWFKEDKSFAKRYAVSAHL